MENKVESQEYCAACWFIYTVSHNMNIHLTNLTQTMEQSEMLADSQINVTVYENIRYQRGTNSNNFRGDRKL